MKQLAVVSQNVMSQARGKITLNSQVESHAQGCRVHSIVRRMASSSGTLSTNASS